VSPAESATDGYAPAAPTLTRALEMLLAVEDVDDPVDGWLAVPSPRARATLAPELWDAESLHRLAERQAQLAREVGALVQLRLALGWQAGMHIIAG
jgi:hypothetical protein